MEANAETASDKPLSTPKNCVHLHLYQSTGKWGAWVRDKRIKKGARLFVGTHRTKYLAARCQDRATLMIRHRFRGGSGDAKPVKLNFKEVDYEEDEDLRNSLTVEAFIELLLSESRESYKKTEDKSKCFKKFLADVEQGRVADEVQPPPHTSHTKEVKNIKLEAQPDKKEKNKITDTSTQIEGEPSQTAPNISDEEMAKLFAAKQYCPICKRVWREDEEGKFVQCDICVLWVHVPCANVTKTKMKELENGAPYHCPDCQMDNHVNLSSEDHQNLDMINLVDKKENSLPGNEALLQSTTVHTPTRTPRCKRILDNTTLATKLTKTCDNDPNVVRCEEQIDAGSISIAGISRSMAEINLNLPNIANAELSEAHQAASTLCLLKNSNNMLDD